jgi:cytochrome c oxidase subunit 4
MTDVDETSATEHEEHHLLHDHHAAPGHDGEHGAHDQVTDNRYIVIAAILAVITAAEVAASYIDLGPVFIPLLLFMMAVKFFIVASFFMHLRFDNKIFTWMFYSGLLLAVGVYSVALLTFRFFDN